MPEELKQKFIALYGGEASDLRVFASPGRVNLIGEHTDYNGGLVFPAALTMKTTIIARKNGENVIRMAVTDLPDRVTIELSDLSKYKDLHWGNYQAGVIDTLKKAGYDIVGCDLLYEDTTPHGSGLSSSAAIEVSTALMLATFSNEKNGVTSPVDMVEMAKLGQKAENEYVGVNCGIMDQFASAMGERDHALLLDCRDLSFERIPVRLAGYKLVIANTNKKHKLGESKYNERRSECERGLALLQTVLPGKTCLGEITAAEFEANKQVIEDETVRRRVEHVIYEDDRVLHAAEALKKGELSAFGRLMNESHVSLRDLYEVTGVELDTLAEEAWKVEGVLGSRMTGAGFGGSTVSIVREECVDSFIEQVGNRYLDKIGYCASFYISSIGDGGRELK